MKSFYPVTPEVSKILRAAKLTAAEWRIWSYLIEIEPWGDAYQDISTLTVMQECDVSKATYYRALAKFQELEVLPTWIKLNKTQYTDTERQIRARLQSELGGQAEVITAVGRIDLLTETEIIEIKDISDWKGALGQILSYSAFFPSHSKRIHLFGSPDLAKLVLAQSTCSEFGITVTFEEVR
jgi:Fe2+ or Zn2+ uptake regulation protein